MKLTRRQAEAVNQIIKEEVDGVVSLRREREELLDRATVNEVLEGKLVVFLQDAIDELVKQFVRANRWSPSIERDFGAPRDAWGAALTQAASELHHVVDRDVREIAQALAEGMYADPIDDEDEETT